MRYAIVFLLLSLCLAYGAIYMQEGNDGSVIYSTPPPENGQVINANHEVNSVSSPIEKTETTVTTTIKPVATAGKYQSLTIISPKDNEIIQNKVLMDVIVEPNPELQKGDQIGLMLDGKPWGMPIASTRLVMENVERGQHSLSAYLVDGNNNKLIQSDTITINISRSNLNSPTRQQSGPPPMPLNRPALSVQTGG